MKTIMEIKKSLPLYFIEKINNSIGKILMYEPKVLISQQIARGLVPKILFTVIWTALHATVIQSSHHGMIMNNEYTLD